MIQQKEIRAFTKFNGMMEARNVSILNSFIGLKIHFRCDLILETRASKLQTFPLLVCLVSKDYTDKSAEVLSMDKSKM